MGVMQLRLIATWLPILAGATLLIVGGWGVLQVRSTQLASRSDRPIAFLLAAIWGGLGLLAGGFVLVVGVGLAYMDSTTGPNVGAYIAGLPLVIAVGMVVALTSLAGYGLLGRTLLARAALIGSVLGPGLVIAIAIGVGNVVSWADGAATDLETNQGAADLAARSSVLQLSVSNVRVTTSTDGSVVTAVSLEANVHASSAVRIETGGKTPWPEFVLIGQNGVPLDSTRTVGPTILASGSTTAYELSFTPPAALGGSPSGIIFASTYGPARPGTWTLRMRWSDVNGTQYEVTTDVVIKGP